MAVDHDVLTITGESYRLREMRWCD